MEFVTALRGTFDEQKPSLFEVLSEQQLNALLPPTLRYLLTVATHRHPRYLLRILNSFDELYAAAMLLVERHYLRTRGGSFTENFYGLKREKGLHAEIPRASISSPGLVRETLKLSTKDVWKNLIVLVGIPYLKRKLDESHEVNAPRALLGAAYNRMPDNPTLRDRFLYYYRWFLRNIYPSVNAGYYFAMLAFNLAYLFDGSKYHSPLMWLIGTRIRRMTGEDYRAIERLTEVPETGHTPSRGWFLNPREVGPRLLSSLSILLPTSIFALKFLEWWYQSDFAKQLSRRATESVDLPPPVISMPDRKGAAEKKKKKKDNTAEQSADDGDHVPSAEDAPIATPSLLPIFTVPSPEDSASCPICEDDIVTPTACQTGVVYCYSCIHKWIEGMHPKQEAFMEERAGKWESGSLISGFNWINYKDPSHGFVSYQSQEEAFNQGLYSIDPDTQVVRLGVDHKNKFLPSQGRPSIRLESKESFNHGLWIADFLHMPPSQCGVWPAFWAYGADWPNGGELDIIEGANLAYSNLISAHTADGCSLDPANEGLFTGLSRNTDCAIGEQNIGCGYNAAENDTTSYGDGFNAVKGGVYAVQWDESYLRVWHFARGSIPADIEAKNPDPSKWGLPEAIFGGSTCEVDSFFKNMNIVININFCGDYGSTTWKNFDTCTDLAPTCEEYVANNPEAFEHAYWAVNYIDVYETHRFPKFSPHSNMTVPANISMHHAAVTPQPTTEPDTTTTMTTWSTVLVTAFEATPSAVSTAFNKDKIGDYQNLGCFRSNTKFRTFDLALEDKEMTMSKCVAACGGITYAGVFANKCYCADKIDAETRALPDVSACDRVCPGDDEEFCGGFLGSRNNGTALRPLQRPAAQNYRLMNVYADLTDMEKPEIPPAMRPHGSLPAAVTGSAVHFIKPLTTTVTYTIPCPTNPATLIETIYVATVEDCGCTKQPELPMITKMVECDGCGPHGESTITITVPNTVLATKVVNVFTTPTPEPPTPLQVAPCLNCTIPTHQPTPEPFTAASGNGWNDLRTSTTLAVVAVVMFALVL
ncbi:Pex12 amino terminal region-domain-containing protein [Mariannaea sp. PMI_226]|nr:Pex12 amino terminal region-domain-containing protein [Mariannaea sp. PMI_226]